MTKNPIKIEDLHLIAVALTDHIDTINGFLSTCDEGDEVEVLRKDGKAAMELLDRIKAAGAA